MKLPKEIAEAVAKVMGTVGYVQKKGTNQFHNYKFAAIGDLLAKIQPAMVEAGLVIMQSEVCHELIADGGVMTATYEFSLAHTSGASTDHVLRHTGMAGARNTKGGFDDKALNKCHTAARKYFLMGLFQIPTGDVPDPDEEEDKPRSAEHVPDYPQQTTPPLERPKGTNGDPRLAAIKWSKEAEQTIRGFTKSADLRQWEMKNTEAMRRLTTVDRNIADNLADIINERFRDLKASTLAAG